MNTISPRPPKPEAKICEKCEKQMSIYWQSSPIYKNGGHWVYRCEKCTYKKQIECNPNYNKDKEQKRRQRDRTLSYRKYQVNIYGLTLAEYDQMLQKQGGVCAICREPETHTKYGKVQWLSIDHNHAIEDVRASTRGLLCHRCNTLVKFLEMGASPDNYVKYSEENVRSAQAYIEKHKKRQDV